jgi:YesN/AraC family two-component response regulator
LGGILDVLCQASTYKSPALMPMGESSLQILDSEQIFDQISHVLVNPVNMSDLDLSLFQQLKKVIQTGDIAAMNALAKNNSFGSLSFIDQADSELLRSVKDFFIMFCSIDMYLSVEAGMCIPEMLALGIRMINEVEKIKRVPEVISQMEMALSTFTHAVHQFNQQRQSKTMLEVQAYIHEHYAEKITLEDLSRHIGLTPGYLSSRIHKETGLSLADHINRVRVKISKDALVDSRQSINEVAQSVGFLYQNHYARVFRQYTGLSPTEFRERKTGQLNKKIPRG